MKPENQNTHINNFSVGANRDNDPEIVGAQPATGEYIDSVNGQPTSYIGNELSHEKIKGEIIKYQANNPNQFSYECIGSIGVNGNIVEFWADKSGILNSLIRINGTVVLDSPLFDYRVNENFQIEKNENCIGGEVYITNHRTPPMIFNINDLIDSVINDPTKYFAGFNPAEYEINQQIPLDIPVFVELVNVGGGGGLSVGEYQYSIRYSNSQGDRTNWTQATPPIPIVQNLNNSSYTYPYTQTYGGQPDPTNKTRYAIRLRFRVTNIFNYEFIEIKRTALNSGAGIGYTPSAILVGKVAINNGEISVRDFLDPVQATDNVVLTGEEETREISYIEAAKTLRYIDRRLTLMNVKIASKESNLTFEQYNGKEGFEFIENLKTAGYNDPYNHAYKKSYARGEKYGFGIQLYDGIGGKGFVSRVPNLENFYFPNRREELSTDSQTFSFGGSVKAATTESNIKQTHEVFDLTNQVAKTDVCSFKNIIRSGSVIGLTGTRTKIKVNEDCDENDGEIESHGARVNLGLVSVSYQPFTPVRAGDSDTTGHNYVVNTKVSVDNSDSGPDYRPQGFAPNYYGQGIVVGGVDNFPTWAKAFSVVRTDRAKRVVAQGLGTYALEQADFQAIGNKNLATKEANKVWFFSPDIENGVVSSGVLDDIIANPQNYEVQFVSPLGFFSEVYSFENAEISGRDRIIDMVSYARIIRDETGGQINPNEDVNMGINGVDGYNYVGYARWRNTGGTTPQIPPTFNGPLAGNTTFSLAQVLRKTDGRGNYLELEFPNNIYGKINTGGSFDRNFDDDGLKAWTEPVYIINIVSTGANVPDVNIDSYKQTGHYQKLESIIGEGNGLPGQKLILVDERWEDCIPHYNSSSPFASIPRYIYIKDTNNVEQKWVNATFLTPLQISTIDSSIVSFGSYTGPLGTNVQGMYTHEVVDSNGNPTNDGKNRFFNIVFNVLNYYPLQNYKVIVKYDKTMPIRVMGGDTVIGESIFAPIDREADADKNVAENQFAFGVGFPYRTFKINPRYYTIRKAGATFNVIQDELWAKLGYIRQMCFMFTVESKISTPYAYNTTYPLQFFPLINYVIRPNRWDETKSIVDNGIYQDYIDDYGESEKDRWKWGGFRFTQQMNPDYSNEPPKEFFSKPDFGFTENRNFCTRIMWSLPRAINSQDVPGLKTFPANNAFDIDDNQGEIKFAYSAVSGKGENLYAFTEKGICLLLTNKSILSDLDGGELAYMAADTFIKDQYWISRNIGMSDEMWRSKAEGFIPMIGADGSEVRQEGIFFMNNSSVFRFVDNQVVDIGRIKYYSKLYDKLITQISAGFVATLTGVYDDLNQRYMVYAKNAGPRPEVDNMFVFSQKTGRWVGTFDFKFDKLTAVGTKTYGHRNLETYELNQGYIINGDPIKYSITFSASPQQFVDKEFIRVRINTKDQSQKPTRVNFYKEIDGSIQTFLDPSQGSLYLKNYRGFEQYIGRILASINTDRPRFQQRVIIVEIIHDEESEFKIIDTGIQYKTLKGQ